MCERKREREGEERERVGGRRDDTKREDKIRNSEREDEVLREQMPAAKVTLIHTFNIGYMMISKRTLCTPAL